MSGCLRLTSSRSIPVARTLVGTERLGAGTPLLAAFSPLSPPRVCLNNRGMVWQPFSVDLIATRAERLKGDRIALECRNKSWFAEKHLAETIAF